MIEFENGTIQIGAEEIASGLGVTPLEVMEGLRQGRITSLCEKGEDEDAGRHRLTFYSPNRRLRLIINAQGQILKRTSADYTRGQPQKDTA